MSGNLNMPALPLLVCKLGISFVLFCQAGKPVKFHNLNPKKMKLDNLPDNAGCTSDSDHGNQKPELANSYKKEPSCTCGLCGL